MSDFINQIRQSARTTEEITAGSEAFHIKQKNEKLTKSLNEFCEKVKSQINFRTSFGKFEVIDKERVIKGYMWRPLCEEYKRDGFDSFYNNYKYKDTRESWCLHHPKYDDKSYVSWDTPEYKSHLHYCKVSGLWPRAKWAMTCKLTPLVTENFFQAQKMLKEDGIKISHVWIVTKWNQEKYNYVLGDTKGDKLISREVFYTDEITVTQSRHEYATIEFAYEYEFRF